MYISEEISLRDIGKVLYFSPPNFNRRGLHLRYFRLSYSRPVAFPPMAEFCPSPFGFPSAPFLLSLPDDLLRQPPRGFVTAGGNCRSGLELSGIAMGIIFSISPLTSCKYGAEVKRDTRPLAPRGKSG